MDVLVKAVELVMRVDVIVAIAMASAFGLFVGAIPGLTATMAIALLVPVTFFMDPLPAIGAMIACSAMAIFAGDIPAALLRIPGTPASAAYADEAYAMTRNGQADLSLGSNLLFSAIGGMFGTVVLIVAAPSLAELALQFSSFEFFWLALLGLTCGVFIGGNNAIKGLVSLFFGLLVACVGLNNPAGVPRFTFDNVDLMGGIDFIPAMIGLFAISEIFRYLITDIRAIGTPQEVIGNLFTGWGRMIVVYWRQQIRGNVTGTIVGILPGAGADIAAWVSYAISKRFSKTPEKFGTGHLEGIVESTSANNAALGGAWVPALVFGIPGDSITAIVIGVLFMKNMNPGPTLFINNPEQIYAVFVIFIIANLLMIPLGWAAIKGSKQILRVPRHILMPCILMFCIVGAFAINNAVFGIVIMLLFGLVGFLMEENDIPVAPAILGIVLGPMVEQAFVTSMIKADGALIGFFERPIAAGLGIMTILVWISPLLTMAYRRMVPATAGNSAGGAG
jgi:TctA family transporter